MSILFGEMRQVAYVVRDIHAAMRDFVAQGIGPWFWSGPKPLVNFLYEGKPAEPVILTAMSNSGAMQLELVQQVNDEPSMFRDFIRAGREGYQHWSSWPVDYHATFKRVLDAGFSIGHSGDAGRGPYVYIRDRRDPLLAIEMVEFTPVRRQQAAAILVAAADWDGRNPIREGFPV